MAKLIKVGVAVVVLSSVGNSDEYVKQVLAKEEPTSLYDRYNLERVQKITIEEIVKAYELNAILATTRLKDWNMYDSNAKKLGVYEDKEHLFSFLGKDLKEHQSFYNKYKENEVKRVEEQEELRPLENIDFVSVSDIIIMYHYDSVKEQLAQIVRVTSRDKVFRCVVIYNSKGEVVNYLEV